MAIFTGASFLLVCLSVLAWFKVGGSANVKPTVVPQFYPPEEISPLAAQCILRQGNVDGIRMVTIALVSMVTKGIVQVPEIYVELLKDKKTLAKEDSQKISKGEIFLLKELNLKDTRDLKSS